MLSKGGLVLDQIWETQQMFSRFEEAIYRRGLSTILWKLLEKSRVFKGNRHLKVLVLGWAPRDWFVFFACWTRKQVFLCSNSNTNMLSIVKIYIYIYGKSSEKEEKCIITQYWTVKSKRRIEQYIQRSERGTSLIFGNYGTAPDVLKTL